MDGAPSTGGSFFARHQQNLKWAVYTLLLVNFGYFVFDDWRAAQSTLLPNATFLQITGSYATTLDELGWFVILFLLEVETHWIEDARQRGRRYWLIQSLRVICYVIIAHALYAFIVYVNDLGKAVVLSDIGSLCALVGEDLSFTRNLLYERVDAGNCASLSSGGEIYRFFDEPVVSDASGYQLAVWHAWIDVIEMSGWLTISLLITAVMVLQNRGIYASAWIRGADGLLYGVYAILVVTALYWCVFGYYVYTWDNFLWIGGFAMIDANLAGNRKDKHAI